MAGTLALGVAETLDVEAFVEDAFLAGRPATRFGGILSRRLAGDGTPNISAIGGKGRLQ